MKTLFVPEWDKHFENAQSRKYPSVSWVKFPNAHDGNGFGRVAAQGDPEACRIFSAFVLICQVASKCPTRGVLWQKGEALDTEDLAIKTRFPQAIFEDAIPFLTRNKVGWLAWGEVDDEGNPDPETRARLNADSPSLSERTSSKSPLAGSVLGTKEKKRNERKEKKEPKETKERRTSVDSHRSREGREALDYSTLNDPGRDVIDLAFIVTGEDRESVNGKRALGFYRKAARAIGFVAFRSILVMVAGEIKAGEVKRPGAVLTNRLKGAMREGRGDE